MSLLPELITKKSLVKDVVTFDYRSATVFERFGISYCCGGNWSLETICLLKGISLEELLLELRKITRITHVSSGLQFEKWSLDFLIEYIIHIHHFYLKQTLPELGVLISRFVEEHAPKFPFMNEVMTNFTNLHKELHSHLAEEESVIFPYLRQLAHAYESKDSYAVLLVKTLRKPIDKLVGINYERFSGALRRFRDLTGNYQTPGKACISHKVVMSKLRELDSDLSEHIYLENEILFPRVLSMEKELLSLST